MPRQARAVATREAILLAAASVFARAGYPSATLADVIAEAGVTQGSLYFHFESKHALAVAVIGAQHERSISLPADAGGVRAMVLLAGALARQIRADPVVQAGLRLTTESADLFPDHAGRPFGDWAELCALLVRQGIDAGDLRPDLDAAAAGRFLRSAFTGTQVASQASTGWDDLLERTEETLGLALGALAVPERRDEVVALAALVREG
ncbi:ScbR family autoregulator-binding transcription factor [Schumannella sp. 10F1B-5-1]|uniref:ScbR family autoregulator-binding transcription factor n=1 Tax=Schumannella sp. 10F1B-5-1 TaxID=2590780 RepID=UPI001131700E|nr:ScbR family autoregulator-binding transcription factor [Schumannella sp. 10F1B-5-1]TPW76708.1 TetR/AcrR family transcriptional regulator [Schumannella sp. 10F1B-5-1]